MDRVNAKKMYYFKKKYFNKLVNSKDFETEVLLAIENETGAIIAGSMFIGTNDIVQYHLSGTKNKYLKLTPTKLDATTDYFPLYRFLDHTTITSQCH